MIETGETGRRMLFVSAIARGVGYFLFWVLLIGLEPIDLAVGLAAATAATWASLALLPPGEFRLRFVCAPRYGLRFLGQSVVAGVDVARKAFSPDMGLRPGLVTHASRYRRGAERSAFASLTCLLPGTLALRDGSHELVYHVLDTRRPMLEQLTEEEAAFARVVPGRPGP